MVHERFERPQSCFGFAKVVNGAELLYSRLDSLTSLLTTLGRLGVVTLALHYEHSLDSEDQVGRPKKPY